MFLQAGADEALVDESRMLAERAKQAGVETRVDIFPEMVHTLQDADGQPAPEADDAIRRFADWVRPKLDLKVNGSPRGRRWRKLTLSASPITMGGDR